jgi:competence protein ComEC
MASIAWTMLGLSLFVLCIFSRTTRVLQFRRTWWNGIGLHVLLLAAGQLVCFYKNTQPINSRGTNNYFTAGNTVIATIEEPLSEKTRTMKALASVRAIILKDGTIQKTKGNILLYFQKDSTLRNIQYGSQVVFTKPLQPIKKSGNPGGFNYQRYCAFQQINYQVFLQPGEYVKMKVKNENVIKKFLFVIRKKTIDVLKQYVVDSTEAGVAEAMLIGYKDDLDKSLLQSYINTGVVHIIAISGLHLALIYGLLSLLLQPGSQYKYTRWLPPVLIIAGLWLFSLAAGGSPSVLRAAVMFTCLVIGRYTSRKPSVYNSLAASAFVLLCYNPFWLWDIGFQLSYAAVLSIVVFMKPVYNCLYVKNKLLNSIWQLTAVTIAAQIATTPLSVYHFHQLPNLFLLTNIVAVPLSGIILAGELLLCAVSCIPDAATAVGLLLHWCLYGLNSFIAMMNDLPFAKLDYLHINMVQVCAAYLAITGLSVWWLHKKGPGLVMSLCALLVFAGSRSWSVWQAAQQQKLVVYNVPQKAAMDLIHGRHCVFRGDSSVLQDDQLQEFYIKPSRIIHRVGQADGMAALLPAKHGFVFGNKLIAIINQPLSGYRPAKPIAVDVLILSRHPAVTIEQLTHVFAFKQVIFDSSNPARSITGWKKQCKQAGIAFYSVPDEGAFVLNLH